MLLARQTIVVGHVDHDTPLTTVDHWVATAKEFPKVVGSSTQDLTPLFLSALEKDPELLAVMTSKRLITSYHSAQAAATAARSRLGQKNVDIAVVDTLSTDVGAA